MIVKDLTAALRRKRVAEQLKNMTRDQHELTFAINELVDLSIEVANTAARWDNALSSILDHVWDARGIDE